MKKLVLIGFLLISLLTNAQQVSELSKGIVFHWKGDEWVGNRDAVTGVQGQATAVYNVADMQGSGNNRYFSFNGTSDYITLPTIAAFGSVDFSITGKIKTGAIGAIRTIIGGAANSFELYISATGYLTAIKYGGSALTASTTLLAANTEYTFAYVRSSTTGTYYVNGTAAGTCTDSNNYSVECTLLGKGTGYFNGYQFMIRAFNFSLTTQITNYSKQDYPIESTHRGAGATKCILDLNSEGVAKASDGSYNVGYWTDRINSLSPQITGATAVIPPASNLNATFFDGSTSKIALTSAPMTTGSADRSISLWINPLLITGGARMIYTAGTGAAHGQFYIYITSVGALKVGDNTSEVALTSGGYFSLNTWYHIVVVLKSGAASVWFNNVKSAISSTITSINTVAGNTYIGIYSDGTSNPFFGLISNAIAFNSAISEDQIKLLYELGH